MIRLRLVAALALALVMVLPGAALAATLAIGGTVTGTGGAPANGVQVTVHVQGSDMAFAATSDATGAWSLQVTGDPGAVIEVDGTGPTERSQPDSKGCVTLTTATGKTTVTVAPDGTVPPVDLRLEGTLTGKVCSPRAGTSARPAPGVTPPATDRLEAGAPRATGAIAVVLVVLAAVAASSLVLAASRRRASGR